MFLLCFFVTEPATTENNTYWPTLSLHGALPSFPANRYAVLSASSIHAAASGANNRNASTTVRSASPKAVHLRASRSTFSHHAVIHHRSEEHTSELQSLLRSTYAVFCLKQNSHHPDRQPLTPTPHTDQKRT